MLPEFIGNRLKPFPTDLPPAWRLWQHKTLNIHRGVMHWDATAGACTLPQIRDQVRTIVRERFRPSWWRGFGFGAIVSLSEVHESLKHAPVLVDVRNNGQGTWQWIVLHFPATRAALGVCTWTEGYLAPVYHDLISGLTKAGYECQSSKKEMDAFLKALHAVHKKLSVTKRVMGALGGE